MKTFIVLVPPEDNRDARKQCESIENHIFTSKTQLHAHNVRDMVIKKIIEYTDDTYDLSDIEVEPLTDFMDRVNNGEFNPDNYFMSYVHNKVD